MRKTFRYEKDILILLLPLFLANCGDDEDEIINFDERIFGMWLATIKGAKVDTTIISFNRNYMGIEYTSVYGDNRFYDFTYTVLNDSTFILNTSWGYTFTYHFKVINNDFARINSLLYGRIK